MMETLILRIDELDPTREGYPMTLERWTQPGEAPAGGPAAPPVGLGLIPASLAIPGAPDPLSVEQIHSLWAGATGPEPELLRVGAQLDAILAQGDIGQALAASGQRIILDIRSELLKSLPWELMKKTGALPRFGQVKQPISRGCLDTSMELPALDLPLRLMVVIASAARDEAVQAEAEMEALLGALIGSEPDIDLLIMKRPDYDRLVKGFEDYRPHILHWIGHGRVVNEEAWLAIHQGSGDEVPWDTLAISGARLGGALRLAFVNACRTSNVLGDGLPAVTNAFLAAGAPAVIGMNSDINGTDAGRFAGRFYLSLAEGKAVDVAVAEARQYIWSLRFDGLRRREWATPCLHVRCDPEKILKIGVFEEEEQQWRQSPWYVSNYSKNRRFVDRRFERYLTWHRMGAAAAQIQTSKLMVLVGESGVGKSEFARIILERCFLYGYDVLHYAPVGRQIFGPAGINCEDPYFLTVLRDLRDEGSKPDRGLRRPFPPENFYPFNRTINRVLQKSDSCLNLSEEEKARILANPDLDHGKMKRDEAYKNVVEIFASFRACLKECAQERPLVIVLDQIELIQEVEFKQYLYPLLLSPSLIQPNIRFVLPLQPEHYDKFELAAHEGEFHPVTMSRFDPEDWEELAVEYILRYFREEELAIGEDTQKKYQQARELIPIFQKTIREKWKPSAFARLVTDSQ